MKSSEVDILIVPGYSNSGPAHWQTRWEQKLKTARRVEQADFENPDKDAWIARIVEEVARSTRPVVFVAHSLGVVTVAHAAEKLAEVAPGKVVGAFLVAPADTRLSTTPEAVRQTYDEIPTAPLPFPSMLIASRNDEWCSYEAADDLAAAWGSLLIDAGEAGHINAASGHGPWPEGLTRFAMLLSRL
ncbi:RBBP9/YdeN family alpha/beta hydrolase [Hartmannibacter diazotrophicus]|nr:alpha/beta hydrolase [Hartmannibacter diazotrophicus]